MSLGKTDDHTFFSKVNHLSVLFCNYLYHCEEIDFITKGNIRQFLKDSKMVGNVNHYYENFIYL